AHSFARSAATHVASARDQQPLRRTLPVGAVAFAGVLLLGFSRSRKTWSALSCLLLVVMIGFATGCGSSSGTSSSNSSTSTTSTDVATGSYTITVTGTDTTTASITAS